MANATTDDQELIINDINPETAITPPEAAEIPIPVAEEAAIFEDRVITVDRVSRTQKGGRRLRFRAIVVVGDRKGNIGLGVGKSNEITGAVTKATYNAKKHIIT